ncbi:hypothetical protein [Bacillus safensis]|uniref:hypothetical protein n=1 Tax=Bacillus safensis TaxID=561879 RepID=UPI0018CECD1E|nr:hypothetical protein [Bacillus safensis]MBG9821746.1 hypothetical protein [Bacillus safensis]GMG79555.1 hypothetical protein ShirakiTA10_25170 [Bacillus safensis]
MAVVNREDTLKYFIEEVIPLVAEELDYSQSDLMIHVTRSAYFTNKQNTHWHVREAFDKVLTGLFNQKKDELNIVTAKHSITEDCIKNLFCEDLEQSYYLEEKLNAIKEELTRKVKEYKIIEESKKFNEYLKNVYTL